MVEMIVNRCVAVEQQQSWSATIFTTTDFGVATKSQITSLPLGLAKLEELEHTETLSIDTIL